MKIKIMGLLFAASSAVFSAPLNPLAGWPGITSAELVKPSADSWLGSFRGSSGWNQSSLKQITPQNISKLRLIWAKTVPVNDEGVAAITYKKVLFFIGSDGTGQALDASSGQLLWEKNYGLPHSEGEEIPTLSSISLNKQNLIYAYQGAPSRVLWAESGEISVEEAPAPNVKSKVETQLEGLLSSRPEVTCSDIVFNRTKERSAYWVDRQILLISRAGPCPEERGSMGTLTLYDIKAKANLWQFRQDAPITSSALLTSSGLVLFGDDTGRLRALEAKTGRMVWGVNLPTSITGNILSFAISGKQYLGITTAKPGEVSGTFFVFAMP